MIAEHGEKLNSKLRDRFRLNHDELPIFLLFKAGQPVSTPVRHYGDFTEKELIKFVQAGASVVACVSLIALIPASVFVPLTAVSVLPNSCICH